MASGEYRMKWQYRTVKVEPKSSISGRVDKAELDSVLAELGSDGWELVTTVFFPLGVGHTVEAALVFKKPATDGAGD